MPPVYTCHLEQSLSLAMLECAAAAGAAAGAVEEAQAGAPGTGEVHSGA